MSFQLTTYAGKGSMLSKSEMDANLNAIIAEFQRLWDSQPVTGAFAVVGDTENYFDARLENSYIISIFRAGLPFTDYTHETDPESVNQWHLLLPEGEGLQDGETLIITYRKLRTE